MTADCLQNFVICDCSKSKLDALTKQVLLLQVTPVLGKIEWPVTFKLNAAEVESVFHVPLSMFLSADPSVYSFRDSDGSFGAFGEGMTYRLHFFSYEGYTIWGLTAGILIEAASVALDRKPEFKVMPGTREYSDIVYDDQACKVKWRDSANL